MQNVLFSSSPWQSEMTQVRAPVMKELWLAQRHVKSVVEQPAASAPSWKHGMAHGGRLSTRSGSDVEFWAAATAAKRARAIVEYCIVMDIFWWCGVRFVRQVSFSLCLLTIVCL